MKIKKEINLFAGMFTAEEIYRYGDIILLLGHIIYLVLFYRFGVYQMVYYNYFSVAFYAVMYFLLHFKKIGKISFTYLVLGEIIVHACMGAYYIGWSAGFTQIMLCIIPIPFFISQNRKAIPYILSSFDVVVFIVMRIIVTNRVAPYSCPLVASVFGDRDRFIIKGGEIEKFRKSVEARRRSMLEQTKYCGDGRIGHGRKKAH